MTALQTRTKAATTALPADLSPSGKLVYLYLREYGSASPEDLKAALGVPQIRLYPTLKSMERRDLIERAGDEYVAQV